MHNLALVGCVGDLEVNFSVFSSYSIRAFKFELEFRRMTESTSEIPQKHHITHLILDRLVMVRVVECLLGLSGSNVPGALVRPNGMMLN